MLDKTFFLETPAKQRSQVTFWKYNEKAEQREPTLMFRNLDFFFIANSTFKM